ncbi:hypothetical protein AYO44_13020 [Planctomycetaceae bacterium SCGC AG-212-F19]|nr:hypothetical protein AYO44_13020 [Planctomycetaceae bacterium SCGC AG-212-F19]
MSDTATADKGEAAPKNSFVKAALGTIAGLMSGAFMMYLSPLLDKVVKPAKPVANFAVDMQGLTVAFHNRSSAKGSGWWDFGDGSPLEPLTADRDTVTHTYAKPGTYTVKLSLRNILNEESERSVTVNLDATNTDPPAIVNFDAVPVSSGSFAPATFRLVSRTKNANLAIWVLDEERPLEIVRKPGDDQDRLVTFEKPGGYVIKMVAVNGEQTAEKDVIVQVQEPPAGALTALLQITEQMTHVEKSERTVTLSEAFTTQEGTTQPINRQIPAQQGYQITAAKLPPISDSGAHNLQIKIASDRHSALLTGELVKESNFLKKNGPLPQLTLRAQLTEERRTLHRCPAVMVTATLGATGSTVLTLPRTPCDCCDHQRQYQLELRDGERVIWRDSRLPNNTPVTIHNRPCTLTATPVGDQVRIDLIEARLTPISHRIEDR